VALFSSLAWENPKMSRLSRQINFQPAHPAPKLIDKPLVAGDRVEGNTPSQIDSAPWAVGPDLDLVIRKAIIREIRRIKFGLYLSLAALDFKHFLLKCEYTIHVAIREFCRNLAQFSFGRHR